MKYTAEIEPMPRQGSGGITTADTYEGAVARGVEKACAHLSLPGVRSEWARVTIRNPENQPVACFAAGPIRDP